MFVMRDFTVDDALISIRYAHHLATGLGYRFNVTDVPTDGVTPLPWALLLAPLARGDAQSTLVYAKILGAVAWTLASTLLGVAVARVVIAERAASHVRFVLAGGSLVVVGLAFPIGAWAVSGMETGLTTAIATTAAVAASARRATIATILAGVAAAFRPELVVWALALAIGIEVALAVSTSRDLHERSIALGKGVLRAASIASAPFVACALVRIVAFGHPAPLALLAKPSDLSHGVAYAAAAAVVVLTPMLVLLRVRFARAPIARTLLVALLVHLLVVIAVGGDWMPYARLMVPVAPSLVIAFVADLAHSSVLVGSLRVVVACGVGVVLAVKTAPAGLHVGTDRAALIARARPVLASSEVVAALDIGWVSAATDASIVDLAGLTDPRIAVLPGGHTSKRVSTAMLLDRGVDTFVAYSSPRLVELRVIDSDLFASHFVRVAEIPVRGAAYTIYRLERVYQP